MDPSNPSGAPSSDPRSGEAPRADGAPAPLAAGEAGARTHRGGPLAVARAVFWSFLGIRRRADLDADVESLTPAQLIAGGIIGAIVLVGLLMTVVLLVTAK